MTSRLLLLTLLVPLAGACDAAAPANAGDGPSTAEDDRGPLGKADLAGTCVLPDGADACGGQSDGACWCDELCEYFGDCCSDYEQICEGGPVTCESNDECGADEYCDAEPGCNTAGECAQIPFDAVCTLAITPYCDCEGNTQVNNNGCIFEPYDYLGECEDDGPTSCTSNEQCGEGEYCEAEPGCDAPGECVEVPIDLICTQAITPYCDCEGNTRVNNDGCVLTPYDYLGECEGDEVCEDPQPLSLTEVSNPAISAAALEVAEDCAQSYEFCSNASVAGFSVPACLDPEVDLGDIVLQRTQSSIEDIGPYGEVIGRDELLADGMTATALPILDAFAGSTQVQAFRYFNPIPCPNCTEEQTLVLVWYPESSLVFELDRTGGYDS